MSRGGIHSFLAGDHVRLGELLSRAIEGEATAYDTFRAGLLRHIAMEEKVLFADARARRGSPLPITKQLHADHAALASMLVPPPTRELLVAIRDILREHDPLEENDDGLYETCERLAGTEIEMVLARMHAIPPVRVSAHVDEPRIHEHIARMREARRAT